MYNEKYEVLKIEKQENYFNLLIKDKKQNFKIWLDCSIENDGEDYVNWQFNQYIFFNDDENDQKAKKYQEDYNNIDNIGYFIQDIETELIKKVKEA